jgi:Protein of unknown function (DUF3626)
VTDFLRAIATLHKGDFPGHPFRGNQWVRGYGPDFAPKVGMYAQVKTTAGKRYIRVDRIEGDRISGYRVDKGGVKWGRQVKPDTEQVELVIARFDDVLDWLDMDRTYAELTSLRKFDPDQPRAPAGSSEGGQWIREGNVLPGYSKAAKLSPDGVIHTSDASDAVRALSEGRAVELEHVREVATLVDKLAELVRDAEAKGEKAPNYDLCKVTVRGTNLFCAESLGIERVKMPQLLGYPLPGSVAATLPVRPKGSVDTTPLFLQHLAGKGYAVTETTEKAAYLRATQRELNGRKVAGVVQMLRAGPIDTPPMIVSSDNYIIDGHHRWAARVALDSADNRLGDYELPVLRADIKIVDLLREANEFVDRMGLRRSDMLTKRDTDGTQPRDENGQWVRVQGGVLRDGVPVKVTERLDDRGAKRDFTVLKNPSKDELLRFMASAEDDYGQDNREPSLRFLKLGKDVLVWPAAEATHATVNNVLVAAGQLEDAYAAENYERRVTGFVWREGGQLYFSGSGTATTAHELPDSSDLLRKYDPDQPRGKTTPESNDGSFAPRLVPSGAQKLTIESYEYKRPSVRHQSKLDVLFNPTRSELKRWAAGEVKQVRWLQWGENTVVWNAYEALHQQVGAALVRQGTVKEDDLADAYWNSSAQNNGPNVRSGDDSLSELLLDDDVIRVDKSWLSGIARLFKDAVGWDESKVQRGKTTPASNDGSFAPLRPGVSLRSIFLERMRRVDSGYKPPDTSAHPTLKGGPSWGSSHGVSQAVTGRAAQLMGVSGYQTDPEDKAYDALARRMLSAIASDTVGSEEVLYHGFQNVRGTHWHVGDEVTLPLTATAGDESSLMYGSANDRENQHGPATLFVFPQGTPMVAYQKLSRGEAKEAGHVYAEAIVAGKFRVSDVRALWDSDHWQQDRKTRTAYRTTATAVYLEPVAVFDPETGSYRTRVVKFDESKVNRGKTVEGTNAGSFAPISDHQPDMFGHTPEERLKADVHLQRMNAETAFANAKASETDAVKLAAYAAEVAKFQARDRIEEIKTATHDIQSSSDDPITLIRSSVLANEELAPMAAAYIETKLRDNLLSEEGHELSEEVRQKLAYGDSTLTKDNPEWANALDNYIGQGYEKINEYLREGGTSQDSPDIEDPEWVSVYDSYVEENREDHLTKALDEFMSNSESMIEDYVSNFIENSSEVDDLKSKLEEAEIDQAEYDSQYQKLVDGYQESAEEAVRSEFESSTEYSEAMENLATEANEHASDYWYENNLGSKEYGEQGDSIIELIDSRPPTTMPLILTRGVRSGRSIDWHTLDPGDTLDLAGFTSTSAKASVAEKWSGGNKTIEIMVPAGSKDVLFTTNDGEGEVILNHGTRFTVLARTADRLIVYYHPEGNEVAKSDHRNIRVNFGRMHTEPTLANAVAKWDASKHPRGKTTDASNAGSFAPATGADASTSKLVEAYEAQMGSVMGAEEPRVPVFHGTAADVLPMILKEGLRPGSETKVRRWNEDFYLTDGRRKSVYVVTESMKAWMWAKEAAERGLSEHGSVEAVILRVDVPVSVYQKMVDDEFLQDGHKRYEGEIKPEWISGYVKGNPYGDLLGLIARSSVDFTKFKDYVPVAKEDTVTVYIPLLFLNSDVKKSWLARVLAKFDESQVTRGKTTPASNSGSFAPRVSQVPPEVRIERAKKLGFDTSRVWYHGTFNNFEAFSRATANDAAYWGDGLYFSSSPEDVKRNYTNPHSNDWNGKVSMRAEEIVAEWENDGSMEQHRQEWLAQNEGTNPSIYDIAEEHARREMMQHDGLVLQTYLRMENPMVLTPRNREWWGIEYPAGDDGEPDYDAEPTGKLMEFIDALRRSGRDVSMSPTSRDEFNRVLGDIFVMGDTEAYRVIDEIERLVRPDLYTDEGNYLPFREIAREAFMRMGYDGIVMDASKAFPTLVPGKSVEHAILFDPAKVRSIYADFDPDAKDSPDLIKYDPAQPRGKTTPASNSGSFAPSDNVDDDAGLVDDDEPEAPIPRQFTAPWPDGTTRKITWVEERPDYPTPRKLNWSFEALKNPTTEQVLRWAGRDIEEVRFVTLEDRETGAGDTYYWDAREGIHDRLWSFIAAQSGRRYSWTGMKGYHPVSDLRKPVYKSWLARVLKFDEAKVNRGKTTPESNSGSFAPRNMGFVSPNIDENVDFTEAANRIQSHRTKLLMQADDEISEYFGTQTNETVGVGAWADGAEQSIIVDGRGDYEAFKAHMALSGLLAEQKAVIAFTNDAKGPDSVYRLSVGNRPLKEVHADLLQAGVQFHTLRKGDHGVDVFVFSQGSEQEVQDAVAKAAESFGVDEVAVVRGYGEFIGSWDSREEGRAAYEAVLDGYEGTVPGHDGGWKALRDRWLPRLQAVRKSWLEEVIKYSPDQPRGKTTPESNSGSFAPGSGRGGVRLRQDRLDYVRGELTAMAERGGVTDTLVQAQATLTQVFQGAKVAINRRTTRSVDDFFTVTGRMKSQFESGRSNGAYNPRYRAQVEEELFGVDPRVEHAPEQRPIYGYVLAAGETPFEDRHNETKHYGDIRMVLKADVLPRTTWTETDSLGDGEHAAVPSPLLYPDVATLVQESTLNRLRNYANRAYDEKFATVLREELERELLPAARGNPQMSSYTDQYIEAQVHGQVRKEDVEEIYLPEPAWEALKESTRQEIERLGISVHFREGQNDYVYGE